MTDQEVEKEFPKLWHISVQKNPPFLKPDGTLVFFGPERPREAETDIGYFVCDLSETDGRFPLVERGEFYGRSISLAGFYQSPPDHRNSSF